MKRRKNTESGQIAEQIKAWIKNGDLQPGERLESIRALAEKYNVGRQVVLSAFQILAEQGFVESRVGSGTHVSPALALAGHCRLCFALFDDDLDNTFYKAVYRGIMQGAERSGGKYEIQLMERAKVSDIPALAKKYDCLVISANVRNRVIAALRKAKAKYVIAGNYCLKDNSNMVRTSGHCGALLDYAGRGGVSFGIIWGAAHLSSTREFLDVAEKYCAMHDLEWNDDSVICTNTLYGIEEIVFRWGKTHRWPPRLVVTYHMYLGFARFLMEYNIPKREWPEMILNQNDSSIPPLPYPALRTRAFPGSDIEYGAAVLEIAVKFTAGILQDHFQALFDGDNKTFSIEEQT